MAVNDHIVPLIRDTHDESTVAIVHWRSEKIRDIDGLFEALHAAIEVGIEHDLEFAEFAAEFRESLDLNIADLANAPTRGAAFSLELQKWDIHDLKIDVYSADGRRTKDFDTNLLPHGGRHSPVCPRASLSSAECQCYRSFSLLEPLDADDDA